MTNLGQLYNIKKKYAELEMNNNEDIKKIKMEKEMMDRRAEREFLRKECIKLNKKFKEKKIKSEKIRDKNDEMMHEKNFVEHEIKVAKANQLKLLKKLDSVKAKYEQLKLEDEQEVSNMLDLKISAGNIPENVIEDKSLEYSKMLLGTDSNDHSLINKHTSSQPILSAIENEQSPDLTNNNHATMKSINLPTNKSIGQKKLTGRRSTKNLKHKSNYRLIDHEGNQIDPFEPYPKSGVKLIKESKNLNYLSHV